MVAVLVNGLAYVQTNAIDPAWVFISTPLKWQSPPPDAGRRIRTTPATMIVLYPSGSYAEVHCVLIQQENKTITISHGDAFVVRRGTWKAADGKLDASSSVVFRTVAIVGKPLPEPPLTEHFTVKELKGRKEIVDSSGQKYAPSPTFNDVEELVVVVDTRPSPSSQ